MDEDLAEKEKKYHKLNMELERRTKELMKDVESVCEKMNFVDAYRNEGGKGEPDRKLDSEGKLCFNLNKDIVRSGVDIADNKSDVFQQYHSFTKSIGDNTEVNSESAGSDTSSFLKAKTVILQNELREVRCLYSEKAKELTSLQTDYKKIEKELNEVKKLSLKIKDSKEACERNYEVILSKLKMFQNENKYLKNEVESLNNELSYTKRKDAQQLKQLLGEIERLNHKLSRKMEHDIRSSKSSLKANELMKLQQDKSTAETFFLLKKQLQLVANLKKQKCILETLNPVKLSESKFLKIFNFEP